MLVERTCCFQKKSGHFGTDFPRVQGQLAETMTKAHFSFNPKYSFPTAPDITPAADSLGQDVLHRYLAIQETLLETLNAVAAIDLRATTVPVEKFVRFNLGDCLKILVYHDRLHLGQAERVLQAIQEKSA